MNPSGSSPWEPAKRYYPDGEDALILWQNSLEMTDFGDMLAQAPYLRHQSPQKLRVGALNAPNLADCHGGKLVFSLAQINGAGNENN